MWDDIIIGQGNKGNSATHIFKIKGEHSISHNGVSFWIHDAYLGMGMTIFKDTIEGRMLTAAVEKEVSIEEIQPWLISLVIKNIDPIKMQAAIEIKLKEAFDRGSRDRAAKIRSALLIEYY
jgi:hypothetical protein